MKILSKDQILLLHDQMIAQTGGLPGIRDTGLLDSALSAPFQTFGDVDLYPTIIQKAARLGYGLITNHAFFDGNKRIGAHAMLVLLFLNHIELEYSQESLETIIFQIASSQSDYNDLLNWLIIHRLERIAN